MAIFGPPLGLDLSSGFELLKQVLDGTMKAIPNIPLGIVDVRDLADLHIRAMTNPAANGQRFLALSGGIMTLSEIAMLLKEKLGNKAKTLLGWHPRTNEEAILATDESLIKFGRIG